SHGTTKRSASRPLGEESYPSVALGNLLLARTLVILMVAHALGCMWILEQPKGSVMELHPLFQEMMGKLTMWKHTISMGRYGANSDKPTWLYASHNCVEDLEDFKPKWLPEREDVEMAVIYEDSKGLKRVKGGRHLKASQAYPIGFGKALSQLRSSRAAQIRAAARSAMKHNLMSYQSVPRNTRADSRWSKHAKLHEIFDYLA
ncbi:Uncharacterized protein (Fragment), partial [Durusdinium trenchii]